MWTDAQPAGARVTVFPVWPPQARILGSFPFILWREEWMTQVADEKRQARLAGGLQTDEREAEQLQSVLLSAGRGSDGGGWGVEGVVVVVVVGLPRVPEWRLYQQPTCSDTRRPKPTAHFFQLHLGLGVTFLFVAMATQDSLSFPSSSHMSRCGQTHTCEVCSAIEANSPLVDGCFFFLLLRAACEQ